MKKIQLSLTCMSISLLLFSCGGKNDSAVTQDPKEYYHNVDLHMQNVLTSYQNFDQSLSTESKNDINTTYDAMIKSFDTEKKALTETKTLQGEDEAISKSLKDNAVTYVDVYIDGAKKELLTVKSLVLEGNSSMSTEVLDVLIPFLERTDAAKSPYIKLKKEFRTKYGFKSH